ncbi:unnamed protein product [Hymenolepis diminuta]|uniref:Uncharacterized protein n=1 Tax=Hymenolepis diminuta TaxID=6216 RepID=A0A564YGF5_HYMDI|nr:unnamed protein product [Hymenolepis diminuta]
MNTINYGASLSTQILSSIVDNLSQLNSSISDQEARNQPIAQKTTRRRSRILRDSACIRRKINRNADFVAIFTSIETVLSISISVRTAIRTDIRRDSVRAVSIDSIPATGEVATRINMAKSMARRGNLLVVPKLDKVPFKVSSASGDAVQLSGAMKLEAASKGKIVTTVCYVAARDISLVGLDWIDMFSVLEPKVQSVTGPQVRIKEKYQRTEDFGQADGVSPLIENQPS